MRSQELFDRARAGMPDVVNSPARAFGAVGMTPRFIARAGGDRIGYPGCVFFTPEKVVNYAGAQTGDTGKYTAYFKHMPGSGIYPAPSRFEAVFLSVVHTAEDLQKTLNAVREFVK